MAKFKYKFENILTLRKKLEDIKKREYGESLQTLEVKKEEKAEAINALDNNIKTLQKSTIGNIDKDKITMYKQYHTVLKQKDITASKNLGKAMRDAENKRNELIYAMKSKKTLSILKDKKYEQFVEEEKKQEQQIIDEIVSFSYSNNTD